MSNGLPAGYVIMEKMDKFRLCIEGDDQPLISCPEKAQVELFFEKLFSEADYHLFWTKYNAFLFVAIPDFDWMIETRGVISSYFHKTDTTLRPFLENKHFSYFHTKNTTHLGAHLGRLTFEDSSVSSSANNILDLLGKLTPRGLKKNLSERTVHDNAIAAQVKVAEEKFQQQLAQHDASLAKVTEKCDEIIRDKDAEIKRLVAEAAAFKEDAAREIKAADDAAKKSIAFWKDAAVKAAEKQMAAPKPSIIGVWVKPGTELTITKDKACYGSMAYGLTLDMDATPAKFVYSVGGIARYVGLFKLEDEGKKLVLHYRVGGQVPLTSFDETGCHTEIYIRR